MWFPSTECSIAQTCDWGKAANSSVFWEITNSTLAPIGNGTSDYPKLASDFPFARFASLNPKDRPELHFFHQINGTAVSQVVLNTGTSQWTRYDFNVDL